MIRVPFRLLVGDEEDADGLDAPGILLAGDTDMVLLLPVRLPVVGGVLGGPIIFPQELSLGRLNWKLIKSFQKLTSNLNGLLDLMESSRHMLL